MSLRESGMTEEKSLRESGMTEEKSLRESAMTEEKSLRESGMTEEKSLHESGMTEEKSLHESGMTENVPGSAQLSSARHPGSAQPHPGSSKSALARPCSALLVLLLLFPPTTSADFQSGLNAFDAGLYAQAMEDWREVVDAPAENTHPAIYAETLYAIAMLYWMGQGVPKDYFAASIWLQKAADRGHAGAQTKLGYLYTKGIAVEQDYKQAFKWFSLAARQGEVDGQYNLGIFYLNGWGTEQDITMGKQYLAAAAAQGDAGAEAALYSAMRDPPPPTPTTPVAGSRMSLRESGMTGGRRLRESGMTESVPGSAQPTARHSGSAQPHPESMSVTQNAPKATDILPVAWIMAQDPDRYTIQVIGLSAAEKLNGLVEGHDALAPFATYTVRRNGKTLYILVQGNYADVDAARRARDNFPRSIQKTDQLWIRQFGMIQDLMVAAERDGNE